MAAPNFVQVEAPLTHPLVDRPREDEDYDHITLFSLFNAAYSRFSERPCLGRRSKKMGEYEWETYADLGRTVSSLGSFLVSPGGANLSPGDHLAVLAPNCPEWIAAEHSTLRQGIVGVPLYSTLGSGAVAYVLRHAEISVAVCARQLLPVLLGAASDAQITLRTVVVIPTGDELEDSVAPTSPDGTRLVAWKDALEAGSKCLADETPADPNEVSSIVYTSGTTGDPKGVMLTGKNIATAAKTLLSLRYMFGTGSPSTEVHMSYLPLAHVFERQFCASFLREGGAVGFMSGPVSGLFDDIEALRPTILNGVPRVWKKLRDAVTASIDGSSFIRRALFNYALRSKAMQEEGSWGIVDWDSIVFSKLRQKLGGRCLTIVSGGAALSADMHAWLSRCFCVRVLQGYGLSESFGGITLQLPADPGTAPRFRDSIGFPMWQGRLRIVDVPELGYFASDEEPRGEVWIQAPVVFAGYYKDAEKTREMIFEDESGRWLRTGDVGKINGDGSVTLFDRTKSVFKLAQGEFVAAEYVESLLSLSPLVAQVWVFGNSSDVHLSAVVHPNKNQLCQAVGRDPAHTTMAELCSDPTAVKAVLASLHDVAKQNGLPGFQIPKALVLDAEGFTQENDLTTPTFKYKRANLRRKFAERVALAKHESGEK